MRYFVVATLLVGGLIHLLPLVGALGGHRLASLYGVPIVEPNLAVLMRHRAVLFGLLGGVMVLAIFKPALQALAFTLGLLSVSSFLYLAWSTGPYNSALSKVVAADMLAFVCLGAGAVVYAYSQRVG